MRNKIVRFGDTRKRSSGAYGDNWVEGVLYRSRVARCGYPVPVERLFWGGRSENRFDPGQVAVDLSLAPGLAPK